MKSHRRARHPGQQNASVEVFTAKLGEMVRKPPVGAFEVSRPVLDAVEYSKNLDGLAFTVGVVTKLLVRSARVYNETKPRETSFASFFSAGKQTPAYIPSTCSQSHPV